MTKRSRNLSILAIVALLVVLSLLVVVPGSPLSKDTKLGLDLEGGIELVYQGQPTGDLEEVTPAVIDDAIETIRKRTDSLGVSEPEIQRQGRDQLSIGLPDVQNAGRAIEQVGTTAQLHFYDWEPNVLTESFRGADALFEAALAASKEKPKAEAIDVPVDSEVSPEDGDRSNDATQAERYYLFGPDKLPIGPDKQPQRRADYQPSQTCDELLADYEPQDGEAPKYHEDTECAAELEELGAGGPPAGSRVIKVPRGVFVVEEEPAPNQPEQLKKFVVLEDDSELSGSEIKDPKAQINDQGGGFVVSMEFTDDGAKAFERLTKRVADRGRNTIIPGGTVDDRLQRFAAVLDNEIVSLATINFQELPNGIDGRTGAQIEGLNSSQEAEDLAENLRIGALPIELKLISQTQVSATLGKQALNQGLLAAVAGLALTILFLLLFYRVLGMVATGALLIYAVLLFAMVKLIPITLTLPGIAGLVLTLAVAADANIVMYERIKEEARTGRSIPSAIAAGYSKALRTIIDANVVTVGVAFVLFTLATAGVKGFAFTLGIGTLVSLLTAVLATSAILGSMARTRLLRRPSALGVGKKRKGWTFDFMGKARWFFSASGLILVVGALAIAGLGIKFGIDFEAGTRITTPLEQAAGTDEVSDAVSPLGFGTPKVQEVQDEELGENVVQLALSQLGPNQVEEVRAALDQEFGVPQADFTSNSIGPTFGEQIARTALIAIVASLLLISLYIGFRFEWKFAVPILIALAHDLLITAGVYSLMDREVTTATVAALLTIMGYSLYDTVIVFDRIRENVPRMPRATFSQIANRSMAEVLTRSLATSFVVLMPVGSLMLFGGETLRDFAFALLVGVMSGAYSSIFIATPVLVEWKERETTYMRRRKLVMEEHGGMVPAFASATVGPDAGPGAVAPAPRPPRRAPGRSAEPSRPAPAAGLPTGTAVAEPPAEPPSATSSTGTPRRPRPAPPKADVGDGDGAAAPPDSIDGGNGAPPARTSSTAGQGAAAPRPKPSKSSKRNKPRRKHGRR
jgi:SecD/SecF fusion protein